MRPDPIRRVNKQKNLGGYSGCLLTLVLQKRPIAIFIMAILLSFSSFASVSCQPRFVNPITDICWSCLLPISIGPLKVGSGMSPAKRDTKNPTSPLCACSKGAQPIPIPGISLGFWEPARMIDVTSLCEGNIKI